jgi:hypothetical protein
MNWREGQLIAMHGAAQESHHTQTHLMNFMHTLSTLHIISAPALAAPLAVLLLVGSWVSMVDTAVLLDKAAYDKQPTVTLATSSSNSKTNNKQEQEPTVLLFM